LSDEFRQLIDEVKLRAHIEDVVRERVHELRQRGRLWTACCPFHEERTPSFKVDPQRGTWRCYGACQDGGDVISFVERFDRLSFVEALEVLAARHGLSLPERRGGSPREAWAPLYDVLERAQEFYARALRTPEGRPALEDLERRGFGAATIDEFGLGWAPASGDVLVRRATDQGLDFALLERAGLARRSERGRAYDFFRNRWTVPIRDGRGRTVGFGARRLGDGDPSVPKYVNTSETPLFHKGRLIFGLDRALPAARRAGHLLLVEGYTDVMAAHQAGLSQTAAVLGTSFTDDHAALVRKSGARRVSLVFDGDEAGRRATVRALTGLLPLELDVDVVSPPSGQDPCDVLLAEGAGPFEERLAHADDWLAFLVRGLGELSGVERLAAQDEILELVALLRPLAREARLAELAERLGYPLDSVREQFDGLAERRAQRSRRARTATSEAPAEAEPARPDPTRPDAPTRMAWGEMIGAAIVDPSFVALIRPYDGACPDEQLGSILGAVLRCADAGRVDEDALLSELADDPARALVGRIVGHAQRAESARALFEGALRAVGRRTDRERVRRAKHELVRSGSDSDEAQESLRELHTRLRQRFVGEAADSR